METPADGVEAELRARFPEIPITAQPTTDPFPTLWVDADHVHVVLSYLKTEAAAPYPMLYDLTAIDERERAHREHQPDSDFTVVYQLLSFARNEDLRLKVASKGERPAVGTVTDLWPAANWYEREVWDMFGVEFRGHPHLARILMPPGWVGHPLRREHPARATDLPAYAADPAEVRRQQEALIFSPEDWGLARKRDDTEFLFLNLGPQHPGMHGVLRFVLQLDGEELVDVVPDIGFHHRAAEKMGERQTWHSYIPYTDRIDYMAGVSNNLPYVLAVEQLAGIVVPDRAAVIRVMMVELFRIISHLVWLGTYAQDLGQMSSVFYAFNDRERAFDLVEAITGGRMHPAWFRIGGVAQDLPRGWDRLFREFLTYMPGRLREYEPLVMNNPILRARTKGIAPLTTEEAVEWGVTGPMLRATGLAWDWRKQRPYSGYQHFDFEVPTATSGDLYDRAEVRMLEMWQSLRIVQQAVDQMPAGPFKSDHPLTTPPRKDPGTMQHIETLIHHFLSVSWGPVIPPGEAQVRTEAPKGNFSFYLVSDGDTRSYRTRARTPSFPHMQFVPEQARGLMVPDLIAILGATDFVLAEIDR
jgi:NADH-quinone oxidoreductase subunit C/D